MGLMPAFALPDATRWFCVHTKPRAEALALENLQRQSFECFLPRIRRSVLVAGRRRLAVEALFPRYLFLRADPQQQSLAPIRSTTGALGLVRFANQPGEVPPALIERLRADSDADGVIVPPTFKFQAGDAVAVLDGALAGLRGVYMQPRGPDRALVLLEMLGAMQKVLLPLEALQKTQPACLA